MTQLAHCVNRQFPLPTVQHRNKVLKHGRTEKLMDMLLCSKSLPKVACDLSRSLLNCVQSWPLWLHSLPLWWHSSVLPFLSQVVMAPRGQLLPGSPQSRQLVVAALQVADCLLESWPGGWGLAGLGMVGFGRVAAGVWWTCRPLCCLHSHHSVFKFH